MRLIYIISLCLISTYYKSKYWHLDFLLIMAACFQFQITINYRKKIIDNNEHISVNILFSFIWTLIWTILFYYILLWSFFLLDFLATNFHRDPDDDESIQMLRLFYFLSTPVIHFYFLFTKHTQDENQDGIESSQNTSQIETENKIPYLFEKQNNLIEDIQPKKSTIYSEKSASETENTITDPFDKKVYTENLEKNKSSSFSFWLWHIGIAFGLVALTYIFSPFALILRVFSIYILFLPFVAIGLSASVLKKYKIDWFPLLFIGAILSGIFSFLFYSLAGFLFLLSGMYEPGGGMMSGAGIAIGLIALMYIPLMGFVSLIIFMLSVNSSEEPPYNPEKANLNNQLIIKEKTLLEIEKEILANRFKKSTSENENTVAEPFDRKVYTEYFVKEQTIHSKKSASEINFTFSTNHLIRILWVLIFLGVFQLLKTCFKLSTQEIFLLLFSVFIPLWIFIENLKKINKIIPDDFSVFQIKTFFALLFFLPLSLFTISTQSNYEDEIRKILISYFLVLIFSVLIVQFALFENKIIKLFSLIKRKIQPFVTWENFNCFIKKNKKVLFVGLFTLIAWLIDIQQYFKIPDDLFLSYKKENYLNNLIKNIIIFSLIFIYIGQIVLLKYRPKEIFFLIIGFCCSWERIKFILPIGFIFFLLSKFINLENIVNLYNVSFLIFLFYGLVLPVYLIKQKIIHQINSNRNWEEIIFLSAKALLFIALSSLFTSLLWIAMSLLGNRNQEIMIILSYWYEKVFLGWQLNYFLILSIISSLFIFLKFLKIQERKEMK